MSTATQTTGGGEKRPPNRLERLRASDPQFRDSFPSETVVAAKREPGLRLAQLVQVVMEGYADRPAVGHRARELVTDQMTGRKTLRLLPRFDAITYRDLWARARAVAGEWHNDSTDSLKPGDFVCILGFASPDYATLLLASIHLGAVIVPLPTSAPAAQLADIVAETEPRILATGIEYLDAAVSAVLSGTMPQRMMVFDYDSRDDDQREKLESARQRLAQANCWIVFDTLDAVVNRAKSLPAAPLYVPNAGENPLAWLFYTSGSTGTPKGAMYPESVIISTWLNDSRIPVITLSFMPMSHIVGNSYLLLALANGGTSYCAPKSDLSTLLEDLSLGRPTMISLVPRVCELLRHHFVGELDRRIGNGAAPDIAEKDVKREMREHLMGGRLLLVGCGSASLAPETHAFMESMLNMRIPIGYSGTELTGRAVLYDGKVQRPPVIAYKLVDVPELGYFSTDKPYPRGELLVKTERFMGGYYKRAELTAERLDEDGFYKTGDIMAELGPDRLMYLDRRNNVVKLSQGEFVATSRLELLYSQSPIIRQIYLYGNSERAFLLAVVVPAEELAAQPDTKGGGNDQIKPAVRRSLHQIAKEHHLNSYEIPRDFLIETVPFSEQNGLLSELGKFQRPKLQERYGDQLEQLYAKLAQDQLNELRSLRAGGADRPVLETVSRAVQATLGVARADVCPDSRFSELGGDSLSALTFSILLQEIFGVEVPVGAIVGPTGTVQHLADYIGAERSSGTKRPSFATVHLLGTSKVYAGELTLDKFVDNQVLANAPMLPPPKAAVRSVLVTGSTGFLGRFLALAWLERLAGGDGKLICIARGTDAVQARQRIESAFSTDTRLLNHFQALASDHLEVLAGDIASPNLGLDASAWARLARTVDLIVHPAAHVNHVLPYNQLFAANVVGTAEVIRLAITSNLKRLSYISTLGVNSVARRLVDEDSDIRNSIPVCEINERYANGYGISKWASEVLLREAHESCGLPVAVFRPGMILAHRVYSGQLNVPDLFTRLLFSLVVTGIAPSTFYAHDTRAGRPRARYEGIPVDFLAESMTEIGARESEGFNTYNVSSPYEDGISLDTFVDWLNDAGHKIERIDNYGEWLSRFETAMRSLPEERRQSSLLALLEPYIHPETPVAKSRLPAQRFCAALEANGFDIPHLSAELINKYVADLRHLHLI
ncbi:MAG: thioester reductase domain-containing protein [Verrucomicrobia bacterium]|nr:thioester reductase domain-containing protein [Verrucomicrobiota bacterium]